MKLNNTVTLTWTSRAGAYGPLLFIVSIGSLIVGYFSATLNALWIVMGLLLCYWSILCLARLKYAVGIAVFLIPLVPQGFALAVGNLPWISPQRILLIFVLTAWVLDWMFIRKRKPRFEFIVLISLTIATFSLSTLFSVDPVTSFKNLLSWLFEYFMLFWLIVDLLMNSSISHRQLIMILVGAGVIASLWGLIEFFTGYNLLALLPKGENFGLYAQVTYTRIGMVRMRAMFVNHITFGSFLLLLIPLAYYMFSRCCKNGERFLWFLILLFFSFVALLTFSRGVYLGAIVLGYLLILPRHRMLYIVVIILILTLLLQPYLFPEVTRLPRALANIDAQSEEQYIELGTSIMGRVNLIVRALPYIAEKPLFGTGLQTYNLIYQPLINLLADNYLFQLLLEIGILGTVALSTLLISILLQLRKISEHVLSNNTSTRNLPFLVLSSLAAFLTVNITSSGVLALPVVGSIFFVVAAMGITGDLAK